MQQVKTAAGQRPIPVEPANGLGLGLARHAQHRAPPLLYRQRGLIRGKSDRTEVFYSLEDLRHDAGRQLKAKEAQGKSSRCGPESKTDKYYRPETLPAAPTAAARAVAPAPRTRKASVAAPQPESESESESERERESECESESESECEECDYTCEVCEAPLPSDCIACDGACNGWLCFPCAEVTREQAGQ